MSPDTAILSSPSSKGTTEPLHFFKTILMNMKNKPDVDWKLVAQKAGYKSANSAQTRYRQILKKLEECESGVTSSPSKIRAPTATSSRGSGTNLAPSKVKKSTPKHNRQQLYSSLPNGTKNVMKRQKMKNEVDEDDDGAFWLPTDNLN